MACAIKRHVLYEVGYATLILVFLHRASLNEKPIHCLATRAGIGVDIIGQAVGKPARPQLWVTVKFLRCHDIAEAQHQHG